MGALIAQMFLSLGIVLAVMIGIAFVVKRLGGFGAPVRKSDVRIDVIAHTALQPKRSLYVVRIGRSLLVLGSAENGLSMMTELHDDELLEKLDAQSGAQDEARLVVNAHNLIARLTGAGTVVTGSGAKSR